MLSDSCGKIAYLDGTSSKHANARAQTEGWYNNMVGGRCEQQYACDEVNARMRGGVTGIAYVNGIRKRARA